MIEFADLTSDSWEERLEYTEESVTDIRLLQGECIECDESLVRELLDDEEHELAEQLSG